MKALDRLREVGVFEKDHIELAKLFKRELQKQDVLNSIWKNPWESVVLIALDKWLEKGKVKVSKEAFLSMGDALNLYLNMTKPIHLFDLEYN